MKSPIIILLCLVFFTACNSNNIKNNGTNHSSDSQPNLVVLDVQIDLGTKVKKRTIEKKYLLWAVNDVESGKAIGVGIVQKPKFPMRVSIQNGQLLSPVKAGTALSMSVRLISKKDLFSPPLKGQPFGFIGGIKNSARSENAMNAAIPPAIQQKISSFKLDPLVAGEPARLLINHLTL